MLTIFFWRGKDLDIFLLLINQDKKIESSGIFDVESNVLRVRSAILDVMTLRCPNPNCRVAVDPTPDACSAILCLNCGWYYCNLCFKGFGVSKSGDLNIADSENRAAAHTHAASHNTTASLEERDAFLSPEIVRNGQREHITKLLVRMSALAMSSKEFGIDSASDLSLAMILSYSDIKSLQIEPTHIWKVALTQVTKSSSESSAAASNAHRESAIDSLISDDTAFINSNTDNSQTPPTLTPPDRGTAAALSPSAQLSLAISSNNLIAAQQLLQMHVEQLDLNYVDPRFGFPPTSLAIFQGLNSLANELISKGANVLPTGQPARSVFYLALEAGRADVVEHILAKYPDVDLNVPVTTEAAGYCPLHVVARCKQLLLLMLLLLLLSLLQL